MKPIDVAPERLAAIVHMRPSLAAAIKGRHLVQIPTPALVPPVRVGERLFLIEWIGAPTGRADLVKVEAIGADGTCGVFRSYCWAREKRDTDLKCVSLTVDESRVIPLIG